MSSTLYAARHIVSSVDAEGQALVHTDAALQVVDGKVTGIGPLDQFIAKDSAAAVCRDYAGATVLPGFVNAHHHIGVTPVERGIPDLPLEQWVIRRVAEPAIDPYLDALYGAMGMISSGITTVMHLHANKLADAETLVNEGLATIRGYRDAGMRVSFAIMFFDQNALGYVGSQVADSLSAEEAAAMGGIATAAANMDFAAHKAVLDTLAMAFADDDGVRIQLAPANLHWCSHRSLEHFAALSSSTGLPLHMHLLETPTQRRYADWRAEKHGPIDYLRKLGFSGSHMTLGHGTWISGREIDQIAEAGYSVCHNCSSNLRLSSGLAPVRALIEAGVNVALGIDEAGLNDDHDMLQEMRLAHHLSKALDPAHPSGLSMGRVLHMATAAGARSMGWSDRLGSLSPGHTADFVVIDQDMAAFPGRADQWSPLEALIYRGRPEHVRAVHVAGEVIWREGTATRVDAKAIRQQIGDILSSVAPLDPHRAALIKSVESKVEDAHVRADAPWYSRTEP